jgi:hypothetical protein
MARKSQEPSNSEFESARKQKGGRLVRDELAQASIVKARSQPARAVEQPANDSRRCESIGVQFPICVEAT